MYSTTKQLSPSHLHTWSTGESLRVAYHAHVVSILLQLWRIAAVEARKTHLLTFDPIAGVAAGEGLVADFIRPLHAFRVGADVANRMQGRVAVAATESTRPFATTYMMSCDTLCDCLCGERRGEGLTTSTLFELNHALESAVVSQGHGPVELDAATPLMELHLHSFLLLLENLFQMTQQTCKSSWILIQIHQNPSEEPPYHMSNTKGHNFVNCAIIISSTHVW